MNTEKDYSLLRPFDLEAAKAGESICMAGNAKSAIYIAGPDKSASIICDVDGYFREYYHTALRMAPLCWVEGKPVYKGDVLYGIDGFKRTAKYEPALTNNDYLWVEEVNNYALKADDLTWTPPKVKRECWVNVYPKRGKAAFHLTKQAAEEAAICGNGQIDTDRVACIRIEWEEPAGGAA